MAVNDRGEVYAWGSSQFGQLGLNHTKQISQTPGKITALTGVDIVQVACGNQFTVFLSSQGRMYTCGRARYGQLGHGVEVYEDT